MSLVLFIVNPIAGKRNKFLVIREIKHFCAKNNIDYEIFILLAIEKILINI